jgi:hypothetical protein
VVAGNSAGRYVPELIEVLDNPRLKEGLNTFEAWSSDVHHFSGEEPKVARDVLYREIEGLDIVDKLGDLRRASDRLGTRAPEANRLLSDITGGVEEIVNRVNGLPSGGDVDPAEVSDLRLRSEHTLRRIETFRSLYRSEFAPPSVTTLEEGGDISSDLGSRLDPVQVYVNGVRLWTKGESGRAFRVFRHIDRKSPSAPVASRARDMMIWIYADAGRFGRDTKSAEHIEKMLGKIEFATPATYARLQDLIRTLETKRMAGPSVRQLRGIKVRLGGSQMAALFLVGLTVSQFLGSVTVLRRLRINGSPVDLTGLDQKKVLAALGSLPSPWTVGSRSYRYERGREKRLVSGVIFRRGSAPWRCPPGLARKLEALDRARPGLFDPAGMRVLSFEGEGPLPEKREKK